MVIILTIIITAVISCTVTSLVMQALYNRAKTEKSEVKPYNGEINKIIMKLYGSDIKLWFTVAGVNIWVYNDMLARLDRNNFSLPEIKNRIAQQIMSAKDDKPGDNYFITFKITESAKKNDNHKFYAEWTYNKIELFAAKNPKDRCIETLDELLNDNKETSK